MSERVGLFTEAQEEFLTEMIAEKVNVNHFILKMFKKKAIKIVLSSLDNLGLDKLQPSWKFLVIPIIDAALNKQYEIARQRVALLLETKIVFKGVKTVTEQKFWEGITVTLATSIDMFVEKKQAQELADDQA